MAQSVDEILAGAKKTLQESNEKFPPLNPQPTAAPKPSYTQAHEARKASGIGDELAAKKQMTDKAKKAIQ